MAIYEGLKLMIYGMSGIFAVTGLVYISIKVLMRSFPNE
jgi:hypothetical protein